MMSKILQKSRYLTFAILVIFLMCELTLRLFFNQNFVLNDYPKIYAFDSILGYRGIPNIEGHIRKPSIDKHFKLNNFGFYGPDFQAGHPDSIFRIGVFGSSRVEGIWANQVESFPELLNKMLREKGYKVEVINLGVSGADRDLQNIELVRESAPRFKLNIALLEGTFPISSISYFRDKYNGYSILFTGNNSLESKKSWLVVKKKVDLVSKYKLYTDIWDLSYSFRFLAKHADNSWGTLADCLKKYSENSCDSWQYYSMIQYNIDKSIEILNDLQLCLKGGNTKLIVFSYSGGQLWKGLENNNIVKFSTLTLDINLNQKQYMHKLDGHPNYLADQVIAERFFSGLVKYIPQQFRP